MKQSTIGVTLLVLLLVLAGRVATTYGGSVRPGTTSSIPVHAADASGAMIGTLSNRQGTMIKLVALDPYGHWNFKPAAEDMWAFRSRFQRDPATGALRMESTR